MEEGSYKLYYTQPLSRACIFWSKIISTLIFIVGLTLAIVFIGFFYNKLNLWSRRFYISQNNRFI